MSIILDFSLDFVPLDICIRLYPFCLFIHPILPADCSDDATPMDAKYIDEERDAYFSFLFIAFS